jgi:uncharacterized protein (TIGR03545 family)
MVFSVQQAKGRIRIRMIRWKGLIAFAMIVGLIILFNLIFLDRIIKGIVEDQASLAVGARVDIGDLIFKIFGLSVEIRDLQVTNPEQPMKNAVQVGSMTFDLATAPLLKKKVVIEKMSLKDLSFGTPRKSSGALPRRLQMKLEDQKKAVEVERRIEDCVLPDFSKLTDLKKRSVEELLAGVNLQSTAFIADYQKKLTTAKETWEKRVVTLPTKETIEKDIKALQSLKDQCPKDVSQLPTYLEKVNVLQEKLKETTKILTDAQQEFQTEMGNLKTSLKEVEKLKDQDLRAVMGKLGIHLPSAMDLICVLLGKDIAQKVSWAITWYRKLGTFMPPGKPKGEKEEPVARPRLKGVDVRFPVTHGYPDFLLELAEFSILSGKEKGSEVLSFDRLAGELRGLTTQPSLYNKPTSFRLEGSLAKGIAKEIMISGQVDHRIAPVNDRLDLNIKDLNIEQLGGPKAEAPLRLASGILNISGYLSAKGEALNGRISVDVHNPKVTVGTTASILSDLFKNMGPFDITMTIGGTPNQPSMALSSSAAKSLSSNLENIMQTRLKGIQDDLKNTIAYRVDKDFNVAYSETNNLEKLIQGEISSRLNLLSLTPTVGPSKEKKGILKLFK